MFKLLINVNDFCRQKLLEYFCKILFFKIMIINQKMNEIHKGI